MGVFGLDLGSYAIKFVQVDAGSAPKLKQVGAIYNPVGQILPNDAKQFNDLAVALRQALKDHGLLGTNCHLAVPTTASYISIVPMPNMSDAELASAIKWEAEQHIPVSLEDVNFEYDVVWRPDRGAKEESMLVFMIGVPKTTVARYLELMQLVGVEVIGLEPEVVSLSRAFFPSQKVPQSVASLICNVGALSSNFVVVDQMYRMMVAHSAQIGSLALTRALEKGLMLDPSQSEEYKRTYGLNDQMLEGRVRQVLVPVFEALVNEIRKTIQFYSSQPGASRIGRLIMTGGGANLPGSVSYLANSLSMEVVVGNPFSLIKTDGHTLPDDRASYGVAVGLASKEF